MRRALLIIVPVALVGVAGALVARSARESDANFAYRQQHSASSEPRQVGRAVMRAREPGPGNNGTRALAGKCTPGNQGERRNPWVCRIRYASSRVVDYQVVIESSGAFHGVNPTGERLVSGCCIALPSAG